MAGPVRAHMHSHLPSPIDPIKVMREIAQPIRIRVAFFAPLLLLLERPSPIDRWRAKARSDAELSPCQSELFAQSIKADRASIDRLSALLRCVIPRTARK